MSFADAVVAAGQHLALDLGWPVMPVKSHSKEPLTAHGVKDATTDERTILHWADRYGDDFNLGVATGFPGPSVLDIDDPQAAAFVLASLERDDTPESATPRGKHLFYAGTTTGTISLGYGELRSVGSYVVVPPSVHPSGKAYVWLVEPRSRVLPPVPASLIADKQTAGVGVMAEREGKVPHGERHDHLKDVAVRLLRAGITDVATLAQMLRSEYETNCEHDPPARADEFQGLAEWASSTRMASRERNRAEHREHEGEAATSFTAPAVNAPLAEHRAYIHRLAGLAADVEIGEVKRFGSRITDGMQIQLSNGRLLDFARQVEITLPGGWRRAVVGATDGAAVPPSMKEPQLLALYAALCRVAQTTRTHTEAEQLGETLREFVQLCEHVIGYELTTSATRFRLIAALQARERFDPFDRNTLVSPALVTDERNSERYLRAGELADWFRFKGAGLSAGNFAGRMAMIGLEQTPISGREPMPLDPTRGRKTANAVLYRVTDAT